MRGSAHRSVLLSLVVSALATGCESPWDDAAATVQVPEATYEVFATDAHLGTWLDRRERIEIRHGMLVLDAPKTERSYFAPGSTVVITTSSPVIAERTAESIANREGLPAGMKTNFALGTTTTVRIERIGGGGVREPIAEGRVSFLEIVVAPADGD
jgi:hypothetical protein